MICELVLSNSFSRMNGSKQSGQPGCSLGSNGGGFPRHLDDYVTAVRLHL